MHTSRAEAPNPATTKQPWTEKPWARLQAATSSVWTVAAVVFLLYGVYVALIFRVEHGAPSFIALAKGSVELSHVSSVIKVDRNFPYAAPGHAYDGGMYYLIALDPESARYYVDHPADRYAKILYPMTARLLAAGRPQLIPYTLILVNWLALALGTLAIAAWLKRKRLSPWFALAYGLYFGLFISFARDLVEPTAYAWLALAIYLFDFGGKRRVIWASICFALAILTRDKSAIFAVAYAAMLLVAPREGGSTEDWKGRLSTLVGNAPGAGMLLAISGLPMLLYLVFLHHWLGSVAAAAVPLQEQGSPLAGFASMNRTSLLIQTPTVYLPALILTFLCVWALVRHMWRVEIVLLVVTIGLSVVTLNPGYFADAFGVPRVAISIVLAALLCFPAFDQLTRGNRSWFLVCSASWVFLTVSFFGFLVAGAL
jgi:hypothetical protein